MPTHRVTANPFWLVQRLAAPWSEDPTRGFDGYFSCEYMGSAEFEWGAIPESLQRIRDTLTHYVVTEVPVDDCKVVYLLHDKRKTDATTEFLDWLTGPEDYPGGGPRAKEATYLPELLYPEKAPAWVRDSVRTIAWWSLRNDVMFTLDHETARRLVRAISTKATR